MNLWWIPRAGLSDITCFSVVCTNGVGREEGRSTKSTVFKSVGAMEPLPCPLGSDVLGKSRLWSTLWLPHCLWNNLSMGVARQKFKGGGLWKLWQWNINIIITCGYTSSVQSTLFLGACLYRKILKNKCYKIESGSNFSQLLFMLTYKECSIIHVIKALNLRIVLYSWWTISRNKLRVNYKRKAVAWLVY